MEGCFAAQSIGQKEQLVPFSSSKFPEHTVSGRATFCASLHFPRVQAQATHSRYVAEAGTDDTVTHAPHPQGGQGQRCQGPSCSPHSGFTVIEAVTGGDVGEWRLGPWLLTEGVAVLGLDEGRRGRRGRLHLHRHTLL